MKTDAPASYYRVTKQILDNILNLISEVRWFLTWNLTKNHLTQLHLTFCELWNVTQLSKTCLVTLYNMFTFTVFQKEGPKVKNLRASADEFECEIVKSLISLVPKAKNITPTMKKELLWFNGYFHAWRAIKLYYKAPFTSHLRTTTSR